MDSKEAREGVIARAVSSSSDGTNDSEKKISITFSTEEERRLLRKFDLWVMPPLMLMFMFCEFDLGNVGNAKTGGWDKDIGLTGNQYYILVMVFFVPFTLFGTPIALLAKYFSAARVLPIMMMGFGVMSILTASAKNFSQVFAIRFFLGAFQSAVLPGSIYYFSTFYKRNELGFRIAVFFAAGALAEAFSGLIAFGTFHIQHSKYHGWQFLFWIEGAVTLLGGLYAYLTLPWSAATWSRLSEREKEIAQARMLADASSSPGERLNIWNAFTSFKEPIYWIWGLTSIASGVALDSIGVFLPQIVFGLGYSPLKTNLYVAAPCIVGAVVMLVFVFSSDHFRERTFHTSAGLIIGFVGFVILICIDPLKKGGVAYFACFLLTSGSFIPSVLISTWIANNTLNDTRRAVVSAVQIGFSNAAGLIATNIFRAQDEPKYLPALATCAAFEGFCLIIVLGLGLYMRFENKRRNREQQVNTTAVDVPTEQLALGPKSPAFRYMT